MLRADDLAGHFRAYRTCQHKGRTFNLSFTLYSPLTPSPKIIVREAILGDTVRVVQITSDYECTGWASSYLCCCSFGEDILAIEGMVEERDVSAFLLRVDDGELRGEALHFTPLDVRAGIQWHGWPSLCQLAEDRALLSFEGAKRMRLCVREDDTLSVYRLRQKVPMAGGFAAVPVRIPGGRVLVAGGGAPSNDIIAISVDQDIRYERIATIPGDARACPSAVLIKNRFVLGFAGIRQFELRDLWIYDLETRTSSTVREEGDWHPGGKAVTLIVSNDKIYFLGGERCVESHILDFLTLAELIVSREMKRLFCGALGMPMGLQDNG